MKNLLNRNFGSPKWVKMKKCECFKILNYVCDTHKEMEDNSSKKRKLSESEDPYNFSKKLKLDELDKELSDKIEQEKRKHENNLELSHMSMAVQTQTAVNFYMNCEKCNNTVSAIVKSKKLFCGEYCNGCKSVLCYECIPSNDKYCKIDLGSKKIKIRYYRDRRCNQIITIDNISKNGTNYCKKCAFKKLEGGDCMVRVKEWEKREN